MTGIWETADVITKARMNEKTIFQGTGAEIAAITTTYPGQQAFCTTSGSGFAINLTYTRNAANTAWVSEVSQSPILDRITTPIHYGIIYNITPTGTGSYSVSANDHDGDFSTKGTVHNYPTTGSLVYDFGEVITLKQDAIFRSKVELKGDGGNTTRTQLQYSLDNSTWTSIHQQQTSSATPVDVDTSTTQSTGFSFRYLRIIPTVFVVGSWAIYEISISQSPALVGATASSGTASNAIDTAQTTEWTSSSEVNPYIVIECSASVDKNIHAILLDINKTTTTETQITVSHSGDNSTFTNLRTLNVSDLSEGINYVRFNSTGNTRYVRVRGSSGDSRVLSFRTISPLIIPNTSAFALHNHYTIDSSTASSPTL